MMVLWCVVCCVGFAGSRVISCVVSCLVCLGEDEPHTICVQLDTRPYTVYPSQPSSTKCAKCKV